MFNPKNKNNKSQHLTASRDIYNQEQGFTIKTDFVKLIEDTETGVNSYNFPIIRDTPITQNIENLLLQSNEEGGYDAYIIEYGFNKEQFSTLTVDLLNNTTIRYTPIDFDTLEFNNGDFNKMVTEYSCTEIWVFQLGWDSEHGYMHGAGCNNSCGEWVLLSRDCNWISYDDGSGEGQTGSTGGNGGGGGGSSDNSDIPLNSCKNCSNPGPPPPINSTPVFPEEEDDCNTSKEDLMELFPNASEEDMQVLADVINNYGADFGINSIDKLRHFLSQTGHETGGYTTFNVTESTYWTTASKLAGTYTRFTMDSIAAADDADLYYAPDYLQDSEGVANIAMCCRMCNGDVASGDGYRYRGRGIVQLTGNCNYTAFQDWYNDEYDPDIDVLGNPDSVATDTSLSILSGLWYFKDRVLDKLEDDEMSVFNVSRMINNPRAKENDDIKGFDDRSNRYNNSTEIINCN